MALILSGCLTLFISSAHGQTNPTAPASPVPAPAVHPEGNIGNLVGLIVALAGPVVLFILWRRNIIRPGSFRGRTREVWTWPWWFWLLCGFLMLFIQQMAATLALTLFGTLSDPIDQQVVMAAAGSGGCIVAGAILLALVSAYTPAPAALTGLDTRLRARDVRRGLIAIAAAYPVVQFIAVVAGWISAAITGAAPDAISHETLQVIHNSPKNPLVWVLGAAAVLGAPIMEELMFRVFLQTAMLRLMRSTWAAILVTSALFSMVHLGGGVNLSEAYVLVPLFALGVAMGIAYERSRTVTVPIVMHMAFNAINLLLLAIAH